MGVNNESRRLSTFFRSTEFGLFVSILLILWAIYFLDTSRSFFSYASREALIHQIGLFGVLAVAASVVIISGGIDLSVGAVVALSSIIAAKLMTSWLHDGSAGPPSTAIIYLSIALTLLMGLAIGLFHAFLINRLALPPFIATLATMSGLRSLASIISENRTINVGKGYEVFRAAGQTPTATFATFAAVAVGVSIMMGATVLGRHLFAMGGNEAAARLSGLKIHRLKSIAYGLSGVLAAIAGILFTGRSGQASSQLGLSYELFAITAAVVGGCSLAGGVGSVRGTVLGLFLLQILIRGTGIVVRKVDLDLLGRKFVIELNSTQVEGLVLGTVIILAVAVNQGLAARIVDLFRRLSAPRPR